MQQPEPFRNYNFESRSPRIKLELSEFHLDLVKTVCRKQEGSARSRPYSKVTWVVLCRYSRKMRWKEGVLHRRIGTFFLRRTNWECSSTFVQIGIYDNFVTLFNSDDTPVACWKSRTTRWFNKSNSLTHSLTVDIDSINTCRCNLLSMLSQLSLLSLLGLLSLHSWLGVLDLLGLRNKLLLLPSLLKNVFFLMENLRAYIKFSD